MKYTAIWKPLAEQRLASIWLDAEDRAAVTAAAHAIDTSLARDAATFGESRSGVTRFAVVPPLAVYFDVA